MDPIDGTKGFISKGQFAIGLAFIHNEEPILGIIGAPNFPYAELYTTQKEWNSYHDGMGCVVVGMITETPRCTMYDLYSDRSRQIECASVQPLFTTVSSRQSINHTSTLHRVIQSLGLQENVLEIDSMCKYIAVALGVALFYFRENADASYRVAFSC